MGTGYTRNDTVNNIADGNIINASDIDGEYDALQAAFDAATGHTHDGTTGEGAPIEVTGPAQEYVSTGTEFRPKANNTYDLGSSGNQWKDLYVDGTANLDAVDIDGGNIDGTVIGAASAAAGTFTNVTANGTINLAGATVSNGGTVTTVDINGGTIDGTVIGGSTPAAISGTTGSFSGNLTVDTNTLFVDASNNRVGIVTSSPATQLEVVGTIRASGGGPRLSILDTGGATDEKEWSLSGSDGPLRLFAINEAGGGSGDYVDFTRVGNSVRTIRGARAGNTSYELSNFDRSLFFSGGVSTIGTATAHDLVVDTNNTERMRIGASGDLLVGKSVIDNDVQGIRILQNGQIRLSTDGAASETAVGFYRNSSAILVGSILTTGTATSYLTSSDYRLKENVTPLAGAADRIAQIPVHRFNFIADPDRTVDGFLAHEVQAFVPEAVTGEKDGEEMQAIDHSKLVPLLTAALQEALQKIEALEARITALEAQP
jgi:hypothetical protein